MENITSLEQQSFKNETTSLKWELLSIRGKINEELNTVLEKYSEGIFFNNFLEIHAQPWYSMWRQDRRQPVSKTGNDCSAGHVLNKCGSSTFTGIQTSAPPVGFLLYWNLKLRTSWQFSILISLSFGHKLSTKHTHQTSTCYKKTVFSFLFMSLCWIIYS